MREAISNTAELGASLGGGRIIDDSVRARMAEVLKEVRAGRFADELRSEEKSGYARLERERDAARKSAIEQARRRLGGED
jgi:ketol-acid reductoisomerase